MSKDVPEETKQQVLSDFDQIFDDGVVFRQSLTLESDRGCALMAAAYLDVELGKLLEKHLVDNKKIVKPLFDHQGPLGTFSARIDMSYALGLIGPEAHQNLHLIRKIRNDFGHSPQLITFDAQAVANRCRELVSHLPPEYISGLRHRYCGVVMQLTGNILGSIYLSKHVKEADDIVYDEAKTQLVRTLIEKFKKQFIENIENQEEPTEAVEKE